VSAKSTKEKVEQEIAQEESNQANKDLLDSELNNVTGGAFPTSVNDQITDSVT